MLTEARLTELLAALPTLTIGVIGDLFLDRYLEIDSQLTEPSIETGLDAYQVVRVRAQPGAAGTVINNLAALGVGNIAVFSMIGRDGEGTELLQALEHLPAVQRESILQTPTRRTPTYTKPLLLAPGQPPRELNRLDIKNRQPLPGDIEQALLDELLTSWCNLHALIILDQVSEEGCGVISRRVRERLAQLGEDHPRLFMVADSRERIGTFRSVCSKPNRQECLNAVVQDGGPTDTIEAAAGWLAQRNGRIIFCTLGEGGILVAVPEGEQVQVPAPRVTGPIDIVGAGDATSAALACAMAADLSPVEAAAFANLVASITIQQLGTTGTATPDQVRQRWNELQRAG